MPSFPKDSNFLRCVGSWAQVAGASSTNVQITEIPQVPDTTSVENIEEAGIDIDLVNGPPKAWVPVFGTDFWHVPNGVTSVEATLNGHSSVDSDISSSTVIASFPSEGLERPRGNSASTKHTGRGGSAH